MSDFTTAERGYMRRALELAEKGMYTARPNPRVGCILVRGGQIVGEGWHRRTGEAHAEINALDQAGGDAQGATAYLNLEPCSHDGKTPPCADALIAAGVSAVCVAMADPNPRVAGRGLARLTKAGIDVRTGLLECEARRLNEGFIARMTTARPFVRLKIAASLDGATAMRSGESQWITGEAARKDVQALRAASGAVMTGIETVLQDDPSLNVRDEALGDDVLQPRRIVLDSRLRLPAGARLLGLPGGTTVFCIDDSGRRSLESSGATVVLAEADGDRPDLQKVLAQLAQLEINDVLVEAGPTLSGALLTAGLVDELVIYQAPHMMGSETRGMISTPGLTSLAERIELEITASAMLGDDMKITARPRA